MVTGVPGRQLPGVGPQVDGVNSHDPMSVELTFDLPDWFGPAPDTMFTVNGPPLAAVWSQYQSPSSHQSLIVSQQVV